MHERPWEELPPRIGALIRPHVPALSDEVIAAIRERVPAYRRPLSGRFGAGIRRGVEEALGRFVDLIVDPGLDRSDSDAVYRNLGRGEHRDNRSLDALLAAYRIGARISWRRVAAIAIDAGVDRRTLALLAEAVFAYIDEISALSAEGYAAEQLATAGEAERRRRRLASLLLAGDVDEHRLREAAREAGWDLPRRVAALAWAAPTAAVRRRLPPATLVAESDETTGLALVGDPDAPGLRPRLERALTDGYAVLGPTVAPAEAARSAARARAVQRLIGVGAVDADGLVEATDQLGKLVAHGDPEALDELAERRLAPLAAETPASRARLAETLRAWLDHQGAIPRVAAELGVHPQTVRYRLARLRERFGAELDDPEARFELAIALRAPVSSRSGPGTGEPTTSRR